MTSREIARIAVDGFSDAFGRFLGSAALLGLAGLCAAEELAHRIAPKKFRRAQPWIRGMH